jgi:hypothetical protein
MGESTLSQKDELKLDHSICKQIMTNKQAQAFVLQNFQRIPENMIFCLHSGKNSKIFVNW